MVIKIFTRWVKFTLFIGIMILMFVSMINSSSNIMKIDFEEMKIQKIAKYVPGIWGILKEDSSRVAAVAKTMKIINKYNRKLDEKLKFEIANEIYLMSIKYSNLDIDLICATITHESALTWEQDVISPAGAMGLMQIMPNTGYFLSKLEGIPWTTAENVLYYPIKNIIMGCRYLSALN